MDETTETPRSTSETVRYWLNEISAAKKREKDFRKTGQRVLDIYSAKKGKEIPFNILFSNTETLLPAIYSAVPRPIVQRRFKDEDALGKAASMAGQRLLEFLIDTNVEGYETYDEGMRAASLDALLPGRGVTCLKYDAELDGETDTENTDTEKTGTENESPTPYLQSELVCVETKSWNRVLFGYAKKWSKVPWIAYEEQIDKAEAVRLFGDKTAKTLTFSDEASGRDHDEEEQGDTSGKTDDERNHGERKTCLIYQIWDKAGGKQIRYLAPCQHEHFLKVEYDPLQLTGFFNCPRPLQFVEKSNDLLPVALYVIYENQAKELNRLTLRLNKVIEAIKVRGVYAGDVSTELAQLMKGDDNELIPAESTSSLAFEKGLQNAIWMLPIQDLIIVAEKLYLAREQCKRVIYEITGLSDIIRGSSVASETATAQTLKSQWGTLRLKRLQKEVQRYARDLLRMMLEIAAKKFSEETWAKMTGLPFSTATQRQQDQSIANAAQMSGQPIDQQIQARLQGPAWPDVLALLRDDLQRVYRVDIETNSTIEPEAAEDHKAIAEMLTAMGQYLQGVSPLVQSGAMPFEVAQHMLLAISRRYRFGTEIEDDIKAMKPPQLQDDGKDAQAQADLATKQMELEKQKAMMDIQAKQMQAEKMLMQKDNELMMREMKLQMAEQQLKAERQVAEQSLAMKTQAAKNTVQHQHQMSSMKQAEHANAGRR